MKLFNRYNSLIIPLALFFLLLFFVVVQAANITGDQKYAEDPLGGILNVAPITGTSTEVGLVVSDTQITGKMWSENYGWIEMQPDGGGVSVTSQEENSQWVGRLSGKAWGEQFGWVEFGQWDSDPGSGVFIDPDGYFQGVAWSRQLGNFLFGDYVFLNSVSNEFTDEYADKATYWARTDWRPDIPPYATDVAITGTAQVNETLVGSYTFNDDNPEDLQGTSTFQWYSKEEVGAFGPVSGATGTSTSLTIDDYKQYFYFEVTPIDADGISGTASSSDVIGPVIGTIPTTTSPIITGTTIVGQTLTGSYTFSDSESDGQGASIMRWLRADTEGGTYTEIRSTAYASGPDSDTYTLTLDDYEKFIKFEVTPIADYAPATGDTATTSATAQIGGRAPSITDVYISGIPMTSQTVTGEYTWSDEEETKDDTDVSTYQWYIASTSDGVFTAITGATTTDYYIDPLDDDMFLKFEVVAKSSKQPDTGNTATSTNIAGPIGPLSAMSTERYISLANKNSFNIQCYGIIDDSDPSHNLKIEYSFNDGVEWKWFGSTTSPILEFYTHSADVDVESEGAIGYAGDGPKEIVCQACDTDEEPDQCTAASSILFVTKDTVIPTIVDDYASNDTWASSTQTITFAPDDTAPSSGTTTPKWCLGVTCDPDTEGATSTTASIATSTQDTLRYQVWDNAGNKSATGTISIKVDLIDPEVSDDYALNGQWTNSQQIINLDSSDAGGSGTSTIKYCFGGGSACDPNIESAVINIATSTQSILYYQSWDGSSRSSAIGTTSVKVDLIDPEIGDDYGALNGVWTNSTQTITLSPSDGGSGASTTRYCWGDTCDTATGTITTSFEIEISTNTDNILRYQTWDSAGNASVIGSTSVKVDLTSPTGGSINYTDGNVDSVYIPITVDRGIDTYSGMNSNHGDYLLEYKRATLFAGNCYDWDAEWGDTLVTEISTSTSYIYTGAESNCYKFRYTVADSVGNASVYATSSEAKLGVPPSASNAAITGTTTVGQILTGTYDYVSNDGGDVSTFQWYSKLGASPMELINGATSTTYELTSSEIDRYVIFEVTPKSTTEPTTGEATSSTTPEIVNDPPTISLATSTQSYISSINYNAFNIQCTGINDANNSDSITIFYSFNNGDNWYELGSTSTPINDYTHSANKDLELINPTGYDKADGVKSIICKAEDSVGDVATTLTAFDITRDITSPTISDDYGSFNGVWTNSSQTITLTPVDGGSGTSNTKYCWAGGTSCDPDADGATSTTINISTSTDDIVYYQTWDNAGNASDIGTTSVKIDFVDPIGAITYFDGYATTTTITIGVDSSDALSDMSASSTDYVLEYATTTLINNNCGGSYGSWSDEHNVTEMATSSSYDFNATAGNCYKFQYSVADAAGNAITATSTSVAKVGTAPTATVHSITGSTDIGQTLTGTYTYFDNENDDQGSSTMQWFRTAVGGGGPDNFITGSQTTYISTTSATYIVSNDDADRNIKFGVTSISQYAPTTGSIVYSEASGTVGGEASIGPATSTQSYISTLNYNAFNIQCTGINDPSIDQTLTIEYSFNNGTNWYQLGAATTSPKTNYTHEVNEDLEGADPVGYAAEEEKSIICRVYDGFEYSATSTAIDILKDTLGPNIYDDYGPDNTWASSTQTITLTSDDGAGDVSGTSTTRWCWTQGCDIDNSTSTAATIDVSTSTDDTFFYKTWDNAGNSSTGTIIVKIDLDDPEISDDYASDGDWVGTAQLITFSPSDQGGSGTTTPKYCWGASCDPNDLIVGTTSASVNISTSTNNILRYQTWDNAGRASNIGSTSVMVDLIDPTGTITYFDGYATTTTITIGVSRDDTGGSGVSTNNTDYILEYATTTLINNNCGGSYGSWSDDHGLTEVYDAASYDFSLVAGNCYKFQYSVADAAGNAITATSTSVAKVGSYPVASNVDISGIAMVGQELIGTYDWSDNESDDQGSSTMSWLSSETEVGGYTEIASSTYLSGELKSTYVIEESELDKYIKFQVTPVSSQYPETGTTTTSDPTSIVLELVGLIASSSEQYITPANYNAFDIKCSGITDPGPGTITIEYSFNESNWYELGTTTSPKIDGMISAYVDLEGTPPTGYADDGSKSITCRVNGGIASDPFVIIKDTEGPTPSDDYASDGAWVNASQTITFTSDDGAGDVSGTSTTKYCWGGSCTPSTGTTSDAVSITTNKDEILRYQTWDNADNVSVIGSTSVKIDLDDPEVGDDYAFDGSWATTTQTITLAPSDLGGSSIQDTKWCWGSSCTPSTGTSSVEISVTASIDNILNYQTWDNAGNTATGSASVMVDLVAPTGTITYFDGYATTTTITIGVDSSDALSGMSNTDTDYILEYKSATLDGTCGGYGSWTDASIQETSATTSYQFAAAPSTCYKFQYSIADIAGNTFTAASTSVTKVGIPPTITNILITGDSIVGQTLTASYDYSDSEAQGSSTMIWERSAPGGFGPYAQISASTHSDPEFLTYELTSSDVDAYIIFTVTPVSVQPPYAGTATSSNQIGLINYQPTVASATSTQSYISSINYTSFNIECTGINDANDLDTLTLSYSFNETNWYELGTTTTPQVDGEYSAEVNLEGNTGYATDGEKTIICKVDDGKAIATSTTALVITKDTTSPVNGSITYTDGYATSTTVTIAVDRGTDASSGMSATNTDYILKYDSSTLSATGTCEAFSESWTDAEVAEIATSTSYEFTTTEGKCYKFNYSVTDVAGNIKIYTSSNELKAGRAPTITNIDITGTVEIDETITGSYIYLDPENDSQGASIMSWLRSSSPESGYVEIASTTYSAASSFNYLIVNDDIGKYLKFQVTPISTESPYQGTATSTYAGPVEGNAPVATNVIISGAPIEGETLTASYTFIDPEDEQGSSTISWWRSALGVDSGYTEIDSSAYPDPSFLTHDLVADDVNRYFKFKVTPISLTGDPNTGSPVFSELKGLIAEVTGEGSVDVSLSTDEEIKLSNITTGSVSLFASSTSIILNSSQKLEFEDALEATSSSAIVASSTSIKSAMENILGISDFSSSVEKVTFNSGISGENIVISSTDNLSVEIPDATNIYADASWDGTIAPPIISSTNVTIGGNPIQNVIAIGASGITLLFNKPAKITIPSILGVPYYSVDGVNWAKIMNICDSVNGGGFSLPDECYIKTSTSTIVWTYHFTDFGMGSENIGLQIYGNGTSTYIGVDITTSSPLRISKGGETYYIPLVPTSSPYASNLRVFVDGVVRALKIFGW